jgi:branched-subunit amino acid aminotransferase/4-amino-4-deoxychorismate lyase
VVVKEIRRAHLTVDDLVKAKEVFLTGSTLRVMPVVSINEEMVAGGYAGCHSVLWR